jgi:GntR family transcriptional regulator
MSIERSPSEYRQVAAILRDRIRSGEYARGEFLPKEDELAAQLKVSRSVVNDAIKVLRSDGLVHSQKGRGTRVHPIPVIPRNAVARQRKDVREGGDARGAFDGELRRLGLTPRVEVTIEQTTANAAIAELLGVDEGTNVLARNRKMYANDTPVQLAISYIPWAIAEGSRLTEEDTGPGGTYSRLAELGHKPVKFSEQTRERSPEGSEAAALGMDVSQRVFHITRIARNADGRAVEVTESIMPAYQWEFFSEWEAE